MFGKKNSEPIPKGVQLISQVKDAREIKLDELTAEILKEDIGFIRDFYQKLVEKLNDNLNTVAAIDRNQTHLQTLMCSLGRANDALVSVIKTALSWQQASLTQIIDSQAKVIESQNQIIAGMQNPAMVKPEPLVGVFTVNNDSSADESARLAMSNNASNQFTAEGKSPSENVLQSFAEKLEEDAPPADAEETRRRDNTKKISENEVEQRVIGGTVDPESLGKKLLDDIILKVQKIGGQDLPISVRDAEHLPGVQAGNIWFVALPPKTDGSYDNTVLQDGPLKKIRALMKKSSKETVVAVYNGVIHPKRLGKAQNAAKELKIKLISFSDISVELGRAESMEEEETV